MKRLVLAATLFTIFLAALVLLPQGGHFSSQPVSAAGDITSNLIGLYTFDVGTAADSSGSGHHGTLQGFTDILSLILGNIGTGALSFENGRSVLLGDVAEFEGLTTFSVGGWVKYDSMSNVQMLMSKANDAGGGAFQLWSYSPSEAIIFTVCTPTCVNVSGSFPPTRAEDGQWHHVMGVYDGRAATRKSTIYIDGVAVNSVTHSGASQADSTEVWIGRNATGYSFDGELDDLRFYNRALSAEDVELLCSGGADGCPSPPSTTGDTYYPEVSITSPTGGTVSGVVTLTARATDNVGIASVQFKAGSTNIGTEVTQGNNSIYSRTFNSRLVPNGPHILRATARDPSGNVRISAPVSITVSNGTDSTAPVFSNVTPGSGVTSFNFSWDTNEPATTEVLYGLTSGSLSNTMEEEGYTENHAISLGGLLGNTVYYYRLSSTDAAGNTSVEPALNLAPATFTTRSLPGNALRINNDDGKTRLEFPTESLWSHVVNYRPGNGDVVTFNPPTFSWAYFPNPTDIDCGTAGFICPNEAPKEFIFQIATDNLFTADSLVFNKRTNINFYNYIPVLDTSQTRKFYWRVGYIYPSNLTTRSAWTLAPNSWASSPYAWSGTRSFTIAQNATNWDRSMFADPTFMTSDPAINPQGKGIHPHVLFTKDTRPGLYAWLQDVEVNNSNPDEAAVADKWIRMKQRAATLSATDLILKREDFEDPSNFVKYQNVSSSNDFFPVDRDTPFDYDTLFPRFIEKHYVIDMAQFRIWFPEHINFYISKFDLTRAGFSSATATAILSKLVDEGKLAMGPIGTHPAIIDGAAGTVPDPNGYLDQSMSSLTLVQVKTLFPSSTLAEQTAIFDRLQWVMNRRFRLMDVILNEKVGTYIQVLSETSFVWQLLQEADASHDTSQADEVALRESIRSKNPAEGLAQIAGWYVEKNFGPQDSLTVSSPLYIKTLGYGYDWFYGLLNDDQKARINRAINTYFYTKLGLAPIGTGEIPSAYTLNYIYTPFMKNASHLSADLDDGFPAALAAYNDNPVARQYLDLQLNYAIAWTLWSGPDAGPDQGGYNTGHVFGSMPTAHVIMGIAFPELKLSNNQFWKNMAAWWNHTRPLDFTQHMDAWGDGGPGAFDYFATPNMGRILAYLSGDKYVYQRYKTERERKYGLNVVEETFFDGLPIQYYAENDLGGLTIPPTTTAGDPELSKMFMQDGWATGCSRPVNKDCFTNGVGYIFRASPHDFLGYNETNNHADTMNLSFQLWAYGAPLTHAGELSTEKPLSKESMGHYSVLVDGKGMSHPAFHPNVPFYSRFIASSTVPNIYTYVAADGLNSYPRKIGTTQDGPLSYLTKAQRHMLFVKGKYFVVFDDYQTNRDATFSFLYHVPWMYDFVEANPSPNAGAHTREVDPGFNLNGTDLSFSYNTSNVPPYEPYYQAWFTESTVPVHVKMINDPASIRIDDMSGKGAATTPQPFSGNVWKGSNVRTNPITGANLFNQGDPYPRAHALWFSNNAPKKNHHFMTVIYPQKPGEAAPTITRIDDFTARVVNADGTTDVISFNPNTAPEDTTILVELADLTPLPVVDDVTGTTIGSQPYEPPSNNQKTLTVTKSGAGSGSIQSTGGTVNCSTTCSYSFPTGTSVTLTAAPSQNSTFSSWGGSACASVQTNSCTFTITTNTSVSATFIPDLGGPGTFGPTITSIATRPSSTRPPTTSLGETITWITSVPATSLVEYGLTTEYGSITTENTTLTRKHSVTLSSLTPGTRYNYRVISKDAAGIASTSPNHTFDTSSLFIDITDGSLTDTTAIVSARMNETVIAYVEYGPSPTFTSRTPETAYTRNFALLLSSLTPNTTYTYRVIARDAAGNISTSTTRTFTTTEGVQVKPLRITSVTLPSTVQEGETFQARIVIQNDGSTVSDVLVVAADGAIGWGGSRVMDIPGGETTVTFNLYAADIHTTTNPHLFQIIVNGHDYTTRTLSVTPLNIVIPEDTTPPEVTITSPAESSLTIAPGSDITLEASASDSVGVTGVQIYVDDAKHGPKLLQAPYQKLLRHQGAASKTYTLYAVAEDAAGNRATSTAKIFAVTVTPPNNQSGGNRGSGGSGSPFVPGNATPPVNIGAGGTGTTTRGSATPAIVLSPIPKAIARGAAGTPVRTLQAILRTEGLLTTAYTEGVYDLPTETAVKAFQLRYRIVTTCTTTNGCGKVGPLTLAKVNSLIPRPAPVVVPSSPSLPVTSTTFTRTLKVGMTGTDVKALQVFLNTHGFVIATTGAGSPGKETTYFGPATAKALVKFQEAYKAEILTPSGLTKGTGSLGPATRRKVEGLK